jgi:hypothetical protein
MKQSTKLDLEARVFLRTISRGERLRYGLEDAANWRPSRKRPNSSARRSAIDGQHPMIAHAPSWIGPLESGLEAKATRHVWRRHTRAADDGQMRIDLPFPGAA